MAGRLAIRADGGPGIGYGHLGRCLALAEVWTQHGRPAVLASRSVPDLWAKRYGELGVSVVDPDSDWLDDAAWVAVDGYGLGSAQRQAKESGRRVLAVDDFGTTGAHVADAVLDQNLDVAPSTYDDRPAGSDLMLGPRYALVRREFAAHRPAEPAPPGPAERLLVAVGGAASPAVNALVGGVLGDALVAPLAVERLDNARDVAAAMARCDFALATAGSTSWELCCMGLPAVVLTAADNQVPVATALAAYGAVENVGDVAELQPPTVAKALARLADDAAHRGAMARAGRELVDGRGAARVEARLIGDLLDIRPATEGDAELLWAWANDPVARQWAFSPDPIPWETHVAWLGKRLADPDVHIYIGADAGTPVGQVRFEGGGDAVEISVSVDERVRGQGFGPALIDACVRKLYEETDVRRVVARLKPDNARSRRAFETACFEREGERSDGGLTWLQYARTRDERAS